MFGFDFICLLILRENRWFRPNGDLMLIGFVIEVQIGGGRGGGGHCGGRRCR